MDHELHINPEQKLALITGAAQRIGRAMAEHLAAKGWSLAIHCNRSEKNADALSESLLQQFPNQAFMVFKADLTYTEEVENLLTRVVEKMGKPELLINNASIFEPGTIARTSSLFFDHMFQINMKAPFLLSREFACLCRKGMIINIVDTRITTNQSNFAAYTLSKKMLWELTKMAAVEFGPEIRVNAIAPGLTLPPDGKDEDYLMNLAGKIPMKRPGGVKPLLQSLDFIIENQFLTGQILFCDGGENLGRTLSNEQTIV
jgi:pteridine reductase